MFFLTAERQTKSADDAENLKFDIDRPKFQLYSLLYRLIYKLLHDDS